MGLQTNLKIENNEWYEIYANIVEITQCSNSSSIIFLKASNNDTITKITSKAYNIPNDKDNDNPPRLIQYIPIQAKERHKAYLSIMKDMRKMSKTPIKTNIRMGMYDYLIRTQPLDSKINWNQIPPVKIDNKKLPDWNLGIIKQINNENDDINDDIITDDQLINDAKVISAK